MNNVTPPAADPAVLFQTLSPEKQQHIKRVVATIAREHGPRAARAFLLEQLAKDHFPASHFEEAKHLIRKPLCPFEQAFAETRRESEERCKSLKETLKSGPYSLFRHLHNYASADMMRKNIPQGEKLHVFFTVAEALYDILGISRTSYYRYMLVLHKLGLVEARGHYCTIGEQKTRMDGTLYALKMQPDQEGSVRLPLTTLFKQDYRNLTEDIELSRTYFQLRGSSNGVLNTLSKLLSWIHAQCKSLQGEGVYKPRSFDCISQSSSGLEAILNVTRGSRETCGSRIAAAVSATTNALGDQHSRKFWHIFYDRVAYLVERGGRDYASAIMLGLERERSAKAEGFARNPAALAISRLKASGVYAVVMGERVHA